MKMDELEHKFGLPTNEIVTNDNDDTSSMSEEEVSLEEQYQGAYS